MKKEKIHLEYLLKGTIFPLMEIPEAVYTYACVVVLYAVVPPELPVMP